MVESAGMRRILLAVAAIWSATVVLSWTSSSIAAPSTADKETARGLMLQGDSAFERRDHAAALKAYRGAHALMNVPSTGIAVARAHAALGQLVEARDSALAVTRLPAAPDEPEAFVTARQGANQLALELVKRIPTLFVQVTGVQDDTAYRLKIDGAIVPPEAHALPRRLNPGRHVILVEAEGFVPAKQHIALSEGEAKRASIELVRGSSPPPDSVEPTRGGGTSPLVYIGFGVGAAGLAVGSVAGALSLSKASSAKENCQGSSCTPAAQDDIDASKSLATVSNIGFGVAIVGAAVGVYGLLSSGGAPPERAPARRRLDPLIGPRFVGLAGTF
jgi:hypothetical protein